VWILQEEWNNTYRHPERSRKVQKLDLMLENGAENEMPKLGGRCAVQQVLARNDKVNPGAQATNR
jgi:hypothetical protein